VARGGDVQADPNGQQSAPNAFEGAASVILTPDRRFLFTTNGGDNSVSSFSIGEDGHLNLLDVKATGKGRGAERHRHDKPNRVSTITTDFGYSNICSYRIDGNELAIAKDPACPKVPEDGTASGLKGTVTAAPPTAGSRRMALIFTRSMEMLRSWWAAKQ